MKKSTFARLLIVLVILAGSFAFGIPALAANPHVFQGVAIQASPQASLPPFDLTTVLVTFGSLTGVAVLITALVNGLKLTGAVKDGDAPSWSAGLNLAALLLVIVLQVLGKANIVPAIDSQAGVIAGILTAMFGLVYQIFASRITHEKALAGLPVIGTTTSGRTAGDSNAILVKGASTVNIAGTAPALAQVLGVDPTKVDVTSPNGQPSVTPPTGS
jgi:hypothetical protein